MKTLPLDILFYEGPIAGAYIGAVAEQGFRFRKMVVMVINHNPATKRRVGLWLPPFLRIRYAELTQKQAHLFWPKQLYKTDSILVQKTIKHSESAFGFGSDVFNSILNPKPLETYAESVERIYTSGLNDPNIAEALSGNENIATLFTGGGIVSQNLFQIKGLNLLHIHPGKLPNVRGADGLLWSHLVFGHPGASCFWMAPDLDMGDTLKIMEFAPVHITINQEKRPDDKTLYRLVYGFVDPIMRARVLIDVLNESQNPLALAPKRQTRTDGVTYHFLGESMRKTALGLVFPSNPT